MKGEVKMTSKMKLAILTNSANLYNCHINLTPDLRISSLLPARRVTTSLYDVVPQ
jgi:hypothetical protein